MDIKLHVYSLFMPRNTVVLEKLNNFTKTLFFNSVIVYYLKNYTFLFTYIHVY